MKLAAVTMVKNECDIIELFVKINSRIFDYIYIIDHMSNDATAEIIQNLKESGYHVAYTYLSEVAFNQSKVITEAVRFLAERDEFDYIMPLDADEFLATFDTSVVPRDVIALSISKKESGLIPWRTYCPISDGYYSCAAPLFENFRMRTNEPKQYYKVIVGNEFAKKCTISDGNHFASNRNRQEELPTLSLMLQHAPVRSCEQIITKAILGSYSLALKRNRGKSEGFHWDEMAKKVRDNNFILSKEELLSIAMRYGTLNQNEVICGINDGAPRIGTEADTIEYKNLALLNVLKSLDTYMSNLVERLNEINNFLI